MKKLIGMKYYIKDIKKHSFTKDRRKCTFGDDIKNSDITTYKSNDKLS